MTEITKREDYEVEVIDQEEEVLVTNTAIKATDVLALIGAGAFAATGVMCLIKSIKKKMVVKDYNKETREDIILRMVQQGYTTEQIVEVTKILDECL